MASPPRVERAPDGSYVVFGPGGRYELWPTNGTLTLTFSGLRDVGVTDFESVYDPLWAICGDDVRELAMSARVGDPFETDVVRRR